MLNFMKFHPFGAALYLRTEGRTDMTNLIVAVRSLANPALKWKHLLKFGIVGQL